MRSEAVLLVLLAAPCVVESAAALPKALVTVDAVLKAMQQSKPVANKKGLLANDLATCSKDLKALLDDDDFKLDQAKCQLACASGAATAMTNAAAGTDTKENCLTDEACTDYKKTCASGAPSGWWVTHTVETVTKDAPLGILPDSTQNVAGLDFLGGCYPSSCDGVEIPSFYKIGKQDPVVTVQDMSAVAGVKITTTTTFEQLPAGFPIVIIIIVVAVLALGVTAYLVKTGKCCCGKDAAGGGAAANGANPMNK